MTSDLWANLKPENGTDGGGHPGQSNSKESIAKSAASRTGQKRSEESRANMRKPKSSTIGMGRKRGIPRTTEEKRKISEATSGIPKREETKQRMKASAKNRSQEQYEKIATGRRKFYADARAKRAL